MPNTPEYNHEYYAKNKAKLKAYKHDYYLSHKNDYVRRAKKATAKRKALRRKL